MSIFDKDLIEKEIPPEPEVSEEPTYNDMVNEISAEINKRIIERLRKKGLLPA